MRLVDEVGAIDTGDELSAAGVVTETTEDTIDAGDELSMTELVGMIFVDVVSTEMAGVELSTTIELTSEDVGGVETIAGVVAEDDTTASEEVAIGILGIVDSAGTEVSVTADAVEEASSQL